MRGYAFWLARGPSGLTLNPTNVVVKWVPSCGYGSTTNPVTVWVTDQAHTNLSDALTFSLIVGECLEPQLGTLILPAGRRGRLPVNLISSEPLTNLMMTLDLPAGRLTDPLVEIYEGVTNIVCGATVEPMTNSLYLINLAACSSAYMYGTQQVAWVYMTAASNQHSAFLTVKLYDSIGSLPYGTLVTNLNEQIGRVIVIGEEPLLEAVFQTNRQAAVVLYGLTGTTNTFLVNTDLAVTGGWSADRVITLTNLFQVVPATNNGPTPLFFRAIRQ